MCCSSERTHKIKCCFEELTVVLNVGYGQWPTKLELAVLFDSHLKALERMQQQVEQSRSAIVLDELKCERLVSML